MKCLQLTSPGCRGRVSLNKLPMVAYLSVKLEIIYQYFGSRVVTLKLDGALLPQAYSVPS